MAEILKQSKTYLVMLSQEELDVLSFALGARYGKDGANRNTEVAHELWDFLRVHRTILKEGYCDHVSGAWEFVK